MSQCVVDGHGCFVKLASVLQAQRQIIAGLGQLGGRCRATTGVTQVFFGAVELFQTQQCDAAQVLRRKLVGVPFQHRQTEGDDVLETSLL
ncbi:hypothetical protein GCM10011348_14350 [Marinobacterium nitratireducens]|uniref:Uncharacterized protein n=1 Tax=Marinobacterium nitratireducens TaxID=518897 RepID=A0A917ZAF9_9GAMM|nr:hypothetical protein GCM10011348_14350 [Marinobacterium nitratireducens]